MGRAQGHASWKRKKNADAQGRASISQRIGLASSSEKYGQYGVTASRHLFPFLAYIKLFNVADRRPRRVWRTQLAYCSIQKAAQHETGCFGVLLLYV